MVVALVMVAAGSRRAIVRVIEEATRVWFEEPVADEKRRRLVKWKRCVLGIASGTSSEGSVALFIQSRALVLGDFGGAEFTLTSSFDCYPLEAVERLVEQSVELLVCEEFWRNLAVRSLGVVRLWGVSAVIAVAWNRAWSCWCAKNSGEIWQCVLWVLCAFGLIDDLIESHIVTGRLICHARKVQRYHRSDSFCNCSSRVEHQSELNQGIGQISLESCKTCGRFIVGAIDPMDTEMLSTLGLEVMDSLNPQLNWKIVTKGRRTRTSAARRKLSAAVSVQPTSGKTEHVPIKKRRHLLRSPSPQPGTPSVCREDSSSQPYSSSPPFGDNYAYSSHFSVLRSASLYSNWKVKDGSGVIKFGEGFDYDVLSEQVGGEHKCVGDFSGIELLATAATLDDDANNACNQELVVEDTLIPKSSDIANPATLYKRDSACNKSLSNEVVLEDDTNCSLVVNSLESAAKTLLGCVVGGTMSRTDSLKVDRRHWDLNTSMDAWDEPYNVTMSGKTSEDVANNDMHVEEGRQGGSESQIPCKCNPGFVEDKVYDLEMENKLIAVSPRGMCVDSPTLEETLREPPIYFYSNVTAKASDQDTENNVDYPSASVEKIDSPAALVEKIVSPAASTPKTNSRVAFSEKLGSYPPFAENIDSHTASAEFEFLEATSAEKVDSPVASTEKVDMHIASAGKIELDTASAEKIESTVDAQIYSDVCLDNHGHVVDSDVLARFEEGHDSPYEDGELRGSFLCPWEETELENKHVDYESDGRHGDSSDAGDLPGSEIVDGGSDGSHSSVRKSLLTKRFMGRNESNSRSFKHSYMHFVEDESENNNRGVKNDSDIDLTIGENENLRKFSDQTNSIDDTVTHMDEYLLQTIQGKVQSCSNGRSSVDAFSGKDIFFLQQCRSHRLGSSDSHPERDTGAYKFLSRCRHATRRSEKGGAEQWTYWGSKGRYTSSYHGVEGRNLDRPRRITGEFVDKFGRVDFDHRRHSSNYLSKGYLHRPLVRGSPLDRDDRVGMQRRMPLTRGIKENYPQGVGNKHEPLPDNASKSLRLSPYLSSRERSFSPSFDRGDHIPLTCRRSRSRSRTRSPIAWHSNKGRDLGGTRRHIRSADFRSEARMDRMKFPNSNSTFTSYYREGYLSPPRGRRRSPVRLFRHSQKFDATGSSGRPTIGAGRSFSLANDGREGKFETNYKNRRLVDRGGVMHRRQDADDGGNLRRFWQSAEADVMETTSLNKKDDARGTDPRNVPQR
ncbi:hypothetical protein F511_10967 [Dorcoceras hygrometricum]|uniref:Dentin sialophosphoprotein-like n=1 Tax=Dorcoceras hygrometricum TaxID=472368 RepID=A0A2Z7AZY7_9LAMI|nr:hypothetical protein F511_10967 [Dorcoceras hygrometricum]